MTSIVVWQTTMLFFLACPVDSWL